MNLTPPALELKSTRRAFVKAVKELESLDSSSTPSKPTIKKGAIRLAVNDVVRAIRHHHLNYDTFRNVCHAARKRTNLKNLKRPAPLPKLLPDAAFQTYMATVAAGGNLQHEIMLKILFYTAVRNEEMTNIRVGDIDLTGSRIFINDGKGGKDRYVLFLDQFRSLLRAYLATVPDNVYLFESQQHKPYSTRRIHQIVTGYGKACGLKVHPHLLRHQALTQLKKAGIDDAQIQLVSGHSSRKSLEKYTHLGLGDVNADYQAAMRKVEMP